MSLKQILLSLLGEGRQSDESWIGKSKAVSTEAELKLKELAHQSRDLVLKKVAAIFPQEDTSTILRLLDQYGVEAYENERDRVQLAVLKLSEGQFDKLEHYLEAAKSDYRDVLSWAEYPLEHRADTWKMDSESVEQIRQKDRAQYLEWLNG